MEIGWPIVLRAVQGGSHIVQPSRGCRPACAVPETGDDKLSYGGDPRLRRVGKKAQMLCLWCEKAIPWSATAAHAGPGHRSSCRMRGPSIFCERGFAITPQDWARYMIAARSTTFPGAYVCPVCGDRSGSVQLDKHPLLRRRRPGETTAGGIVWTCTLAGPQRTILHLLSY